MNTIFRFKSLINYENKYIELYDYDRIITKKRNTNIYIKENKYNEIKL